MDKGHREGDWEGDWEWQASEKSRVFLAPERLQHAWRGDRTVEVDGEDAHHLTRVLRLRSGAPIVAADGIDTEWRARLEVNEAGRGQRRGDPHVRLRLLEMRPNWTEPPIELVLVQGIPKGEKMDHIVQKAVEVGVTRILPVITRRSVPRYDGKKASDRTARWQRIAREAARQSRRGRIPDVGPIQTWEEALPMASRPSSDVVAGYVAWEMETQTGLLTALRRRPAPLESAWVCIGPEGGLHDEEVALAIGSGFETVGLGPRILRTETAGLVAMCMVLSVWGDLDTANNLRELPQDFGQASENDHQ